MTREQAEKLANECNAIVTPSQIGRKPSEQTDVWAMPYRPLLGWVVRFETGKRRTTITEQIPAERAVNMHLRSLVGT